MCSGCSSNKLLLLPKQEQVLLPNLLNLLVVLGYHNELIRKEATVNLINFLHGELTDSLVAQYLKVEGKETLTEEIKAIQNAVLKGTGIATKDLGGFMYMIEDKRLWAYPMWVLIHWSSLRMTEGKLIELLKLVAEVLPCPDCRLHTLDYLEKKPPTGDLFAWSISFHTASQKGGRHIDVGELEFWRTFYKGL